VLAQGVLSCLFVHGIADDGWMGGGVVMMSTRSRFVVITILVICNEIISIKLHQNVGHFIHSEHLEH